jgi:ATP-dependent exoDNAse (exonuclease V) beta subunit
LIKTPSFRIYNASAGSGKTFTLVKEYLKCIFRSKNEGYYQHLLAITFTNKAVAEMKERIIENLVLFSQPVSVSDRPEMLQHLTQELELSSEEIQKQAKKILKHLLHHYGGFSVETIDRFNHRLIRTFARDLKLSSNFEVTLDTPLLLQEAVDQLVSKAGEDSKITKILLDFALQKTDDDKSWDISKDIASAASLLFDENESEHMAKLKNKSLVDFSLFKKQLKIEQKSLSENIKKIATDTLQLIDESGLQQSDFNGGYFPKHFQNLASGKYAINFGAKWQEDMDSKPFYPKRVNSHSAATIDELSPGFIASFETSKSYVLRLLLIESILKNLTPLVVINLVNEEIEQIKEEKNILPISEFNSLINAEIKDQPAPFVYERLGEKYHHFFIDEFQDTSRLQWENLRPLIDNALSQEDASGKSGTVLLVGDAKQSIYRWRGGLPEQFMELYGEENPFYASEKVVFNLETNYRSSEEIIDFNNQLFGYLSAYFGNDVYKELYEVGNRQKFNNSKGGYVKIQFVEKQSKAHKNEVYAQRVHETILDLKTKGFRENDICILTRSKKDGIFIGSYLMEQGISVISSETLLLESSSLVQCIINSLILSVYPQNTEAKMQLLDFLYDQFSVQEAKHTFFSAFLNSSSEEFDEILGVYSIDFNLKMLQSLSLYQSCEYIIRKFHLNKKADAFLFSFMDLVFEFEQQPQAGKMAFLEAWEVQKDKASIPANEGTQAVQLMTIHKAKGLEFPVVFFPFADLNIYDSRGDVVWYPLELEKNHNFDEAPINCKKEIATYSDIGAHLFEENQFKLQLDNLNLLYVALTRAIEHLYIFSEEPSQVKDGVPGSYNEMFGEFLKHKGRWEVGKSVYEFGRPDRILTQSKEIGIMQIAPEYTASAPQEHNLKIINAESSLWGTGAQIAITEGTVLHDILAQIVSSEDVELVFESLIERALKTEEELQNLREKVMSIVSHPLLKHLFKPSVRVKNEADIVTASGQLLRPDRLNFHSDNLVTIIDYKTGEPNYHHEDQILNYASALEEMNISVSEKILVYTNRKELVINKV